MQLSCYRLEKHSRGEPHAGIPGRAVGKMALPCAPLVTYVGRVCVAKDELSRPYASRSPRLVRCVYFDLHSILSRKMRRIQGSHTGRMRSSKCSTTLRGQ